MQQHGPFDDAALYDAIPDITDKKESTALPKTKVPNKCVNYLTNNINQIKQGITKRKKIGASLSMNVRMYGSGEIVALNSNVLNPQLLRMADDPKSLALAPALTPPNVPIYSLLSLPSLTLSHTCNTGNKGD